MIFRKCHFIRNASKTARGPRPDSIRSEPGIAVYFQGLGMAHEYEEQPAFIIAADATSSADIVNVWDVIRIEPDTLVQL